MLARAVRPLYPPEEYFKLEGFSEENPFFQGESLKYK
jgi:hypothetical protein